MPRSPYRHLELCGIALKRCVSGFAGWCAVEFFRGLFCLGTVQRALCGKRARILPHPRKQSTGLFVSRCGESGLFESRHSVKDKKLFHQTVKELFVVGVTGFEPTASGPEPSALPTALHPEKKSAATLLLRWLGMRESNSHKRSQSPSHYHYANPHCMFVKKLCFRAALNA